ncbi:DUF4870 domain-containing protein [Galbibacter sp. PAP.153]|uniref:DUF4870 domain-containing protein n=1 Tax=Galbibacter sp. PAP.153 TaxID=3104623 RepID=UPI003008D952
MSDLNLSKRVKELRNLKGTTQELLAEKSGLSLRTIQRIENGETTPRGDSLKRLAIALNTTPDEIIDWQIQDDKGYITVMALSPLGFLFFPLLGIIIPLIFWILKKDKLKNVNKLGKAILNFEITWSVLLFTYFIFLFSGMFKIFGSFIGPATILKMYIPIIILYVYNIILILLNTLRVYQNKNFKFIPAINFFK